MPQDAKVAACFRNRLESEGPPWAEHKLESNASSYIMNDSDNNYLWNWPAAAITAGRNRVLFRMMCLLITTPTAAAACPPGHHQSRS